jgi:Protein of unknown function (DUF3363)
LSLKRDLKAERVTALDRTIDEQRLLRPDGLVSALRNRDGDLAREPERIRMLARLQFLESLQLAREISPGVWQPDGDLLPRLKTISIRGDIVKTLHAHMTGKLWELDPEILDRDHPPREAILGRVTARGRVDKFWDDEYLIVDGEKGREFYVPLAGALESDSRAEIGAVVRIEGTVGEGGRARLKVARIAPDLDSQIMIEGVTFLDRVIAQRSIPVIDRAAARGFESAYGEALRRRAEQLRVWGILEREGSDWRGNSTLLDELYEREINAAHARLSPRHGELRPLKEGMSVRGTIQGIEELPSGAHAVVGHAGRYALVPPSVTLKKSVGRSVNLSVGAFKDSPALEPRPLKLAINVHFLSRHRGIGRPL